MDPWNDAEASLRERLERALGGKPLKEWMPAPRALVGFGAAAEAWGGAEQARLAVEKLQVGAKLLAFEMEMLEWGLRLARPAPRVERGRLPVECLSGAEQELRGRLEALLPGIASIGTRGEPPWATAFQVSARVMVTSAHVAQRLWASQEVLDRGLFLAQFDGDAHRPAEVIPIQRILALHPREDVAFLELVEKGPLDRGLCLAREPGLTRAARVLAIGYPCYGAGTPLFLEALFENVYGVKRASPGEVLGLEAGKLFHDCTTLPGSSGSPVLDLRTGYVVGIHASGQFAFRNTAILTRAIYEEPCLRPWVTDWG
jgi:hypothetical protein